MALGIAKHSDELDGAADLGGPVDIIVSEIVGNDLVGEHVLPVHEKAVRHLPKPGGQIIPARGAVCVALAEWNDPGSGLEDVTGFDLSGFLSLGPAKRLGVGDPQLSLRSGPADLFVVDFASSVICPPAQGCVTRKSTGGRVSGIAQWIRLERDETGRYENRPMADARSCWAVRFVALTDPIEMPPGQKLAIFASHDRSPLVPRARSSSAPSVGWHLAIALSFCEHSPGGMIAPHRRILGGAGTMTTTCRCCGRFPLARLMAAGLQSKTSDERRALFATGRPTRPPPAASSASGYLFTGGTILTMDDSQPTVEALLIQGDKVAYAGSVGALPSPLPDGIQVIPLGKNVLLPGFVDPHMHLLPSALNSLMVDLTPQAFTKQGYTIDNVLAALADAVDKALPFGLVLGQGYDSSLLKPWVNLTVAKLDSISKKDIAILVQAGSGHLTFANSTAMKLADIDPPDGPPTPDPFGGYIGRYGEGNSDDKPPGSASGIFVEMPAQSLLKPAMEKRLASLIEDLKRKDPIAAVMQNAVAVGNTLINDAGIGLVTDYEGDKLILEGVFAWGQPVRVASAMFLDEWDASSLPDAFSKGPDFSNPMFVHQAVKLFADGSNQGLTGFLTKPYSPWALEQAQADFLGTHIYGNADDISVDADADAGGTALPLSSLMQQAIANGWQVMIHANGDAGIDNALSAYSAANAEASPDLRHRIEHCSILRDDQLEKMKTLGLSPSFLIAHTTVWGGVLQEILNDDSNPGRANLLDRCQSALGKNMRISLHTDHPVTPLGPLQMIQDAVTRVMQTNGQVLNKAECLSPEQAVRAQTIDAAWQCHMDDLVGSLEVGKLADLVILDRSPLDGDPSTISKIQVVETWVGGKKVYASGTEKRVTGGG